MKIELHIDRLVVDDLVTCSSRELVAAITRELRLVLTRDLSRAQIPASGTVSVPRLRSAAALPAAGGGDAIATGRAIGAAVAGAVTSHQVFPGARRPR